ncbi:4'-phosphopantetheinyl transferase superfamily protein [Bartonella sp. AP331QHHD]|uniref:4'-phosphopantetheinyl transferase superfamily protein n=1 Tax=Bartonella sp. AP331QHHD TaxID=3243490 RepID=UPI0035CF34DF
MNWFLQAPLCKSCLIETRFANLNSKIKLWHATFQSSYISQLSPVMEMTIKQANLQYASNKRKAEFIAGRQLMMQAFDTDLPFKKLKSGAPQIPAGYNASLSHSRNNIALLLGSDQFFYGVDIEFILSTLAFQAVLSRRSTKKEFIWLCKLPVGQQLAAATLLFSAKETLYKLLYDKIELNNFYKRLSLESISRNGFIRFKQTTPKYTVDNLVVQYKWLKDSILTWAIFPR